MKDTLCVRKAVIYCRVSDKKQRSDGDGLHSQEHRCRDYAESRGYVVDAVFHDDVSGGGDFMNRPGMVAMLAFLNRESGPYAVIFDDLKRFARDTIFHLKLRQVLGTYDATVECLNFRFEDSPEGQFVETVIAAQAQLERLQNRRQTIQKMRARIEQGYYVFACPMGYRYEKVPGHGRILVRNEPLASIIGEALEGYASGRFATQSELKRWLEAKAEFPKSIHGTIRNQEIAQLLTRSTYAGYVEAPRWGIAPRIGFHEPLIQPETFHAIQRRLQGKARTASARRDLSSDFPLRGAVLCGPVQPTIDSLLGPGQFCTLRLLLLLPTRLRGLRQDDQTRGHRGTVRRARRSTSCR